MTYDRAEDTTVRPQALLVEPREQERETLRQALAAGGFEVTAALGVYEALRLAQRMVPDIVVASLTQPDGDGRAFIRALRAISSTARVPVVALAGQDVLGADVSTTSLLADCVLDDPAEAAELVAAAQRVLARRRLADVAQSRWDTPAGGLSVVAPDGTRWSVHHVSGQDSRTKETLMFVSRSGYLRVANFPENWRALSTDQLLELGGRRSH